VPSWLHVGRATNTHGEYAGSSGTNSKWGLIKKFLDGEAQVEIEPEFSPYARVHGGVRRHLHWRNWGPHGRKPHQFPIFGL